VNRPLWQRRAIFYWKRHQQTAKISKNWSSLWIWPRTSDQSSYDFIILYLSRTVNVLRSSDCSADVPRTLQSLAAHRSCLHFNDSILTIFSPCRRSFSMTPYASKLCLRLVTQAFLTKFVLAHNFFLKRQNPSVPKLKGFQSECLNIGTPGA